VAGQLEKSGAKRFVGMSFLVLAAISFEACYSQPPPPVPLGSSIVAAAPVSHTVRAGETVYRIAHIYGVSPARLMAVNGLSDPRHLEAGQTLIIPLNHATTAMRFSPWSVARADRQFAWPITTGMVSSPFGIRNGIMHDGIDIAGSTGTAVRAADDGTVIFAGHLHGYGNAVILQHSDGYVTVYGHNRRNLVRYGTHVIRGQEIAELGATGRATGPNLHFEVRFHGQPQNPLAYLPQPLPSSGIAFARNGGS
jgi:murein DD-endopeptidase MepM/ murein hydrolase activator NlpD